MSETVTDGAAPAQPAISPDIIRANLLTLGRRLRGAGLPVGSGQILAMVDATAAIDVFRHQDVYHAVRATVVTRPEQIPVFDAEFSRFWRELLGAKPVPLDPFMPEHAVSEPPLPEASKKKTERRHIPEGAEDQKDIFHISEGEEAQDVGEEDYEASPEDIMLFSARELLRKKDFSQCTAEEIAEARRIIEGMTWRLGTRRTRRRQRARHGRFIDPRATLRGSLRHGGIPLDLRRQQRKIRTRPLVVICDISGSMDRYARLLLRFVHALGQGLENTEVFVFGTRLTRITRELRRRDVDTALNQVVASVDDWSGGTRIGEAIKTFNFKWSRRVLRSGATVVVISDGWDRGDPELLGREMARLQRSCRRLIWLNPLLGAPGYQPLTQGMRAALPYIDEFMPIHNLQSLEALAEMLSQVEDQPPLRKTIPPPSAA
ncbi:MAG: VWA domain-containing protein [Thermomicrobiales bacterium]|nr:VWA domain-containing protein [Thermomicrobiales bacterium]